MAAVHHPLEHPHILAKAGPEEFALGVFAEPVHVEDARRMLDEAVHVDPVAEIVAHVIATEGQHGQGIAADLAGAAHGGGGHFGAHGGPDVNAVDPVESLEDERDGVGAAAAEDDGADGHALRQVGFGGQHGVVYHGDAEAAVGVGSLLLRLGGPPVAAPIQALGRRGAILALPPHVQVGRQRHVGVNRVARNHLDRVGIGLRVRAGDHAEVAGLGVDGVEPAVRAGFHPGDVVADGGDLPALETGRRNHHGEVGLAAGAGEGGSDVGLLARGRFNAQDEHVLGEPAFLAAEIGADAQGQALFPEQDVAAVV